MKMYTIEEREQLAAALEMFLIPAEVGFLEDVIKQIGALGHHPTDALARDLLSAARDTVVYAEPARDYSSLHFAFILLNDMVALIEGGFLGAEDAELTGALLLAARLYVAEWRRAEEAAT